MAKRMLMRNLSHQPCQLGGEWHQMVAEQAASKQWCNHNGAPQVADIRRLWVQATHRAQRHIPHATECESSK